LQDQS